MNNPKSAIDALLEDVKTVDDLTVYPITLGRYALLELVKCPMIQRNQQFNTVNMLPTFYIMTQPINMLLGYNSTNIDKLIEKATLWAEDQPVSNATRLIEELMVKFNLTEMVQPDSKSDATSKKVDAQLPTAG